MQVVRVQWKLGIRDCNFRSKRPISAINVHIRLAILCKTEVCRCILLQASIIAGSMLGSEGEKAPTKCERQSALSVTSLRVLPLELGPLFTCDSFFV